jgi:hypothetical protein
VSIIVDAAQGRFSRRGLVDAVRAGYIAIITGSKFFGGPPFSGALVVPKDMTPRDPNRGGFSKGLAEYLSAGELPHSWHSARSSLPSQPNVGLILRWHAALAEIRRYYDVAPAARLRILRAFERWVPEIFAPSATIVPFSVTPPTEEDSVERLLQSKTTVFAFYVRTSAQPRSFFGKRDLMRIYEWMNRDLSGLAPSLPVEQKAVLARGIHLGQPVVLAAGREGFAERAALRVALSGPLIALIAEDTSLGAGLDERLEWLRTQIRFCRRKLEIIVDNWAVLAASEAKAP